MQGFVFTSVSRLHYNTLSNTITDPSQSFRHHSPKRRGGPETFYPTLKNPTFWTSHHYVASTFFISIRHELLMSSQSRGRTSLWWTSTTRVIGVIHITDGKAMEKKTIAWPPYPKSKRLPFSGRPEPLWQYFCFETFIIASRNSDWAWFPSPWTVYLISIMWDKILLPNYRAPIAPSSLMWILNSYISLHVGLHRIASEHCIKCALTATELLTSVVCSCDSLQANLHEILGTESCGIAIPFRTNK